MKSNASPLLKSLGLLLPLALVAAACGPGGEICGPGTRLADGQCMPVCAPGATPDPETGRCVADCGAGTHADERGACIADSAQCTSGSVWDPVSGQCLAVEAVCAEGTTWVASKGTCVPDERLRQADFTEGYAENEPTWGGAGAFESFDLPSLNEKISLSGRVDAPQDRNGDNVLEPDFDFWLFEAAGPALLRIHADGLGGSTAAYDIVGLWPGSTFHRLAIGSTSDVAVRDVYLPTAGVYALIATDGLNFATKNNGPFAGGGDLGYFIEIEQIPVPEPTPLTFDDLEVRVEGEWPTAPPETGSMLHFYTLPVEAHHAYEFGLLSLGGIANQELFVFGEENRFAVQGRDPVNMGFEGADELLLVADYTVFLSYEPAEPFRLTVYDRAITWVEGTMPTTSLQQQEWSLYEGAIPPYLFGLSAGFQEVVTVRASSSTGRTCLSLWDAGYRTELDRWNCVDDPELPLAFEGDLRVLTPYSGFYGLSTVDWSEAEFDDYYGAVHIAPHAYEVGLEVYRQAPIDLGIVAESSTLTHGVTAEEPETFYLMAVDEGGAVRAAVSAPFPNEVRFYEPVFGQLTEAGAPQRPRFAWRSVQGEPALFGVADLLAQGGAYDLEVAPLDVAVVGPAAEGEVVTVEVELPQGAFDRYYRLTVPGAGALELQAQASDVGVSLVPRDLSLAPTGEPAFLGPFPGQPLRRAVNGEGLLFSVEAMGGQPAQTAVTVTVQVTFTPAAPEAAGSSMEDAQVVEPPVVIAGTVGGDDVDVYTLTVAGPKILTFETMPDGTPSAGDTAMLLADGNGDVLASDDEGGVAAYSRIEYEVPEAGTYYLVVFSYQEVEGGYVLEVDAEDVPDGGVIGVGE